MDVDGSPCTRDTWHPRPTVHSRGDSAFEKALYCIYRCSAGPAITCCYESDVALPGRTTLCKFGHGVVPCEAIEERHDDQNRRQKDVDDDRSGHGADRRHLCCQQLLSKVRRRDVVEPPPDSTHNVLRNLRAAGSCEQSGAAVQGFATSCSPPPSLRCPPCHRPEHCSSRTGAKCQRAKSFMPKSTQRRGQARGRVEGSRLSKC